MPTGELQVHGSSALIRWLLDNQLVGEITPITYPVILGQGTRLFPDTALDLVDSRTTPKGVTRRLNPRNPAIIRRGPSQLQQVRSGSVDHLSRKKLPPTTG